MADRALTVKDTCERYGVTEHTVLSWIRSGQLKAINVGVAPGKKKPRWRITAEALADFEKQRAAIPPAPAPRRRRRQADVIEFIK